MKPAVPQADKEGMVKALLNRAALMTLVVLSAASAAHAQEQGAQKLFEAGHWDQAIGAVNAQGEQPPPESSYLAGQSYLRMDQADGARAQFARLSAGVPDDAPTSWSLVGQSAAALIDGNKDLGVEKAQRAVEMASDQFHPNYQLGLAHAAAEQWERAAEAFEKASTIDPGFAYAHYYAGLAYSHIKQVSKMATHFESFLKLAPEAPERTAVTTLMRRVR